MGRSLALVLAALCALGVTPATARTANYARFSAACQANTAGPAAMAYHGPEEGLVSYCHCVIRGLRPQLDQRQVDVLTELLEGEDIGLEYAETQLYVKIYQPFARNCRAGGP